MAGVGLTWYTWFEQGRDIVVSDDFLHRLSKALRLDRAEREHLFALAGRSIFALGFAIESGVPDEINAVIKTWPEPAYVMNGSWDVLAYNAAASILFEDLNNPRPNMLEIVLFSEDYKRKIRDWPTAARLVFLKARHDYLTAGRNPIVRSLLDKALSVLPGARDWWDDTEIVRIGNVSIEMGNPGDGWLKYVVNILLSEDHPSLRIALYNQTLTS